jgi:uncharacterized membrane protein
MFIIFALIAIGVLGVFVRKLVLRVLCFALSVPCFLAGLAVLAAGGIAEPFSNEQMLVFCGLAFTPIIGLTIGEIIKIIRKENNGTPIEPTKIDFDGY